MSDTRPVFDAARLIDVRILSAEADKTLTVQFPSDDQIQRRQRARKMVIKDLGRGVTDTDITPNEDVDLQIVNEIRREGPEVDGAEAAYVLDLVTDVEVVDVEREGPTFRVHVKVPGTVTEHVVRIPSQREIMEQRRNGTKILNLPFGRKEIKINLQASANLYDKLCSEREGYKEGSAVPMGHKVAAVNAAITALEREISREAEDVSDF